MENTALLIIDLQEIYSRCSVLLTRSSKNCSESKELDMCAKLMETATDRRNDHSGN